MFRINRAFAVCLMVAASLIVLLAQPQPPNLPPNELVRRVVDNELRYAERDTTAYMYKERRQSANLTTTKQLIETKDGILARVLAYHDIPLTPEQRAQDDAKLHHLANDPEAMRKKRKEQLEDANRVQRMFREIPNAFDFEFDGTDIGKNGNELLRYRFKPKAGYDPPSREASVFTAMEGHLWVDRHDERLARIDARLFHDVNFGWGILGHLNKGGHFTVEQMEIGPGRWEATDMNIEFTGKVMFFKNINMRQISKLYDWRLVPENLTVAQGVDLLMKAETAVASKNGGRGGK